MLESFCNNFKKVAGIRSERLVVSPSEVYPAVKLQ